ncbi:hypothetical protein PGB90_000963 [Kerria lacca]
MPAIRFGMISFRKTTFRANREHSFTLFLLFEKDKDVDFPLLLLLFLFKGEFLLDDVTLFLGGDVILFLFSKDSPSCLRNFPNKIATEVTLFLFNELIIRGGKPVTIKSKITSSE